MKTKHTPQIAWMARILTLTLFIALINVPWVSAKVYSIGDCSVANNVTMPNMIVGEDDGGIVLLRNLRGENTSKNWAAGGTGANNFGVVFNDTGALIAPTITAVTCQEYGNNTDLLIHVFTNAADGVTLTRYFYNTGLIKTVVQSTKHNYSFRDFGPNGDGFGDTNSSALIFNSTEIMAAQTSLMDADDKYGVIGRTYNLTTNYTWVTSWNQLATKTDFDHQSRSTGTALGSAIGRSDGLLNTTTLVVYQTFARRNTSTQAVASWTAPALSFKWMVENKTVYVNATGGNDGNDGYSWATAKRSIAGLNAMNVSPDTTTCVHSGQVFRGVYYAKNFTTLTTCAGTTPAEIWNSRALNSSGYWTSVGSGLWKSNETFGSSLIDVGNVIFSQTEFPNSLVKVHYSTPPAQINDSSFYYNSSGNRAIYIKSATNPGTRWNFLEAMWDQNVIKAEGINNWHYYNVTLKFSGGHCLGVINPSNVLIEDFVFKFCGGAYHGTFPARYGNCEEAGLNLSNYTVREGLARYCFDAAFTSQAWSEAGNTTAYNVNYTHVVGADSAYGFESFFSRSTGGSRVENLSAMYNTYYNQNPNWHGNDRQNIAYHTMTRQSAFPSGSRNIRFMRNIGQNSKDLTVYASGTGTTYFDNVDILFDYNVYFANRTSNTAGFAKYLNTVYSTQAAYVAATGNDTHSVAGANYFINPAADDFRLYNFSAACALGAGAEPCVNITNKLSVAINVSKNNTVIGTNITPSYDFTFTDDVQLTANCTFVFDNQPRAEVRGLNSSQSYSFPINFTIANGFYEVYVNCTNTQGLTNQSVVLTAEVESPTQKVTGLAQTSRTLTTIGLSWVNPESTSFNYNMVIVNGDTENATITTGETTTLTGLTQGTSYSIVVRSYDTTGAYGTATLTASTRAFATWSGYSLEPISTLLNTYDPQGGWRDNTYAYDENYATYAYIETALGIGWGASINITSNPSRYPSNENRSAARVQMRLAGGYSNATACFQSDGSTNLVYHTFRSASSAYQNYVYCINTTSNASIATSSDLANAKYYESSLLRYYTTSYELTVNNVYTLNGSAITEPVTICNLNTSNCTYGTTPLYIAMLNGTQTLSVSAPGYFDFTTTLNTANNASTNLQGATNTHITWKDTTTLATTTPANCYYNAGLNRVINRTGAYYDLAPGTYTIYCTKGLDTTTYEVTKSANSTYNLTLLIDAIKMNITFYDDTNLTQITGLNITLDMISDSFSQAYSTTTGYITIADLETDTYLLRYQATGYTRRFYSITITDENTGLALYLLRGDSAVNKTVKVIDETTNPVQGAVVKLLKYNLATNTYTIREAGTTNSAGLTTLSTTLNDEYYKFMVEYQGELKLVTSPAYIKDTDTLILQIGLTSNIGTEYYDYASIDYTLQYNTDTNTFRLDYNDANGQTRTMVMEVYEITNTSRTLINTSSIISPAGTILMTITPRNGSMYSAFIKYVDDGTYKYLGGAIYEAAMPDILSKYGVFLQIFITVIAAGLSIASTALAVILVPATLIIGKAIGLNTLSYAGLIPLQVVGIIVAVIISTKR